MNDVFKALSDPTRRRVLQLLQKGPLSAGNLIHAEKASKPIIYHLKLSVLEEALLGFAISVGNWAWQERLCSL